MVSSGTLDSVLTTIAGIERGGAWAGHFACLVGEAVIGDGRQQDRRGMALAEQGGGGAAAIERRPAGAAPGPGAPARRGWPGYCWICAHVAGRGAWRRGARNRRAWRCRPAAARRSWLRPAAQQVVIDAGERGDRGMIGLLGGQRLDRLIHLEQAAAVGLGRNQALRPEERGEAACRA
jgi:hypothetical protein